ncbi:hypothetical protein CDQ84_04765 [Clostridium thermosuccinogenes]|uniref:Stage III sporulation protein AH n=1 Tax=Clostridium thermosuccinogenes TaxID=84032 RepID=A0A2K2FPN4_9CLOT|nr:SpoIIIAH-like family protein [Pseudoclostridium thermosuccinogenes]AUS96164.1 hypothetical protein CDO33_06775 [Pseudoclostridium thermosuccinogenes]PNT98744.1 hypothetical protein CDQ85_04720 [Pseudoclostridium thermosuccinogenes]PNU00743.1 hypothetical protein CDQ84_04765 [Pseudoclostridium thermosuccinogenes]
MTVFKRKQVVALALVLLIIVAGYLQYSYKKSSTASADKDAGKIGEAVYVENSDSEDPDFVALDEEGDAAAASKEANDLFAEAKLNRDMTRSKSESALKEIIEDENASQESRDEANKKMIEMVERTDCEVRIETLIKNKGFEDALAVFADDGTLDICVKAPTLTASDVAKIADIASRQANIEISDITVKNIY